MQRTERVYLATTWRLEEGESKLMAEGVENYSPVDNFSHYVHFQVAIRITSIHKLRQSSVRLIFCFHELTSAEKLSKATGQRLVVNWFEISLNRCALLEDQDQPSVGSPINMSDQVVQNKPHE